MPCAMLRPWFRGGCHACFCRPDGWVPSVLVLCKHEVSPWLPKRTARSAPPSFSPPSRKLPPAAAQKFQTAYGFSLYHFMFDSVRAASDTAPGRTDGAQQAPSVRPFLGGMDGVRRRRRGTARDPDANRQKTSGPGPPRAGPRPSLTWLVGAWRGAWQWRVVCGGRQSSNCIFLDGSVYNVTHARSTRAGTHTPATVRCPRPCLARGPCPSAGRSARPPSRSRG